METRAKEVVSILESRPPEEMEYEFGEGESVTAGFFPLAVAQYVGAERLSVLVVLPGENRFLNQLKGRARKRGLSVEVVSIPPIEQERQVWEVFSQLVRVVEKGEKVVIDLTVDMLPLPFLVFLGIGYLRAVRQVEIEGVYYAARDRARRRSEAPSLVTAINLSSAVDLIDWLLGYHSFAAYGQAEDLTTKLRQINDRLWRTGRAQPREMKPFARLVERMSRSLLTTRWQEVMQRSEYLAQRWGSGGDSEHALRQEVETYAPPLAHAIDEMMSILSQFRSAGEEDQVDRQLFFIDWYVEHNYIIQSLTLMREMVISKLLVIKQEDLLDAATRRRQAQRLNHAARLAREGMMDNPVVEFWDGLAALRNDVAHAGMRKNPVSANTLIEGTKRRSRRLRGLMNEEGAWKELHRFIAENTFSSGQGVVLLSPLGTRPGTLYSAIMNVKPDRLYVVTSPEAVDALEEVIREAGFQGKCRSFVVEDPFLDYERWEEIKGQLLAMEADTGTGEMFVNFTGGTTALEFIVAKVGREVAASGIPTTEAAVVDRRPVELQRENPFVPAEMHTLQRRNYDHLD